MPFNKVRDEDELTRAHDMLVGILLGEIKLDVTEEFKRDVTIATDVLCWVLCHEYNKSFAENLASIKKLTEAAGYCLVADCNPRRN